MAGQTYDLYSVPAFIAGVPERVDGAEIGSSKHAVQTGDILICKINPRINRVWEVGPSSSDREQIASTEYLVLRLHDGTLRGWVSWYLRSPVFRRWITANVEGATGSHTRAKSPAIMRQLVPLGVAEQRERLISWIETQTSRLAATVRTLSGVREKLPAFKGQLLNEAFATAGALWPSTRIGDLIESSPQNGLYVPKSKYGRGVPILRIDDFQMGRSRPSSELRRVNVSHNIASRYLLRPGDVVINRVNSPSHLGKTLAVRDRNLPALFESNMMRVRLSPEVEPRFAELYLRSPIGRGELIRNAKWAVNQASINQGDVLATSLPVPPKEEQRRVIETLDAALGCADELGNAVKTALDRIPALQSQVLRGVFGA